MRRSAKILGSIFFVLTIVYLSLFLIRIWNLDFYSSELFWQLTWTYLIVATLLGSMGLVSHLDEETTKRKNKKIVPLLGYLFLGFTVFTSMLWLLSIWEFVDWTSVTWIKINISYGTAAGILFIAAIVVHLHDEAPTDSDGDSLIK